MFFEFNDICIVKTIHNELYSIIFLKRKAEEIRNKNMNDIHQKKLDDLSMINTQASVNLQNELVKGIIFQK